MKKDEISLLIEDFKRIKEMGYIKEIKRIGAERTFSNLVGNIKGKYKNIKVKLKKDFTTHQLTVFTAPLEGKEKNQIKRLNDKFGVKESYGNKALNTMVKATSSTCVNYRFLFKLKVDYEQEKVFLVIYDNKYTLIDNKTYWTFANLQKCYLKKKKYLFYIKAWVKAENNINYFKFYDYYLYELKDFKEFLKLLEDGMIQVTLRIDTYSKKQTLTDRSSSFEIEELNLEKLYTQIKI